MDTLSFNHIIDNLTHSTNIGYYMIHLERATEREPLIKQLENTLKIKLNIFPAADGHKLVKEGHPTTCQQRGPPATRGAGDIGCTVSHINICKDAIEKNYDYIVILEDDCEFVYDLSSLNNIINNFINLKLQWDLFLLGYEQEKYYNLPGTEFRKVSRFNLTHSVVLNRTFMKELIKTYEEYYNNNTTLSIDTMYSNVIENNNLNAYGHVHNKMFIQKPGMYSYIVERVR